MKLIGEWKKVLESDLEYIISELIETVSSPTLIVLTGPVGAGKTTFAKAFEKYLSKDVKGDESNKDKIVSPTYSIVNDVGPLIHADFYRIKDNDELLHLELPLYTEGKDYFLVEWGKDYINFLSNELGDCFEFYEIVIELNDDSNKSSQENFAIQTRNYFLSKLDT